VRRRPALLALPLIIAGSTLPLLTGTDGDAAAFEGPSNVFISDEVAITDSVGSPSDCTPSQIAGDAAARNAVDAQDDAWRTAATDRGLTAITRFDLPEPTDPDRVPENPLHLTDPAAGSGGTETAVNVTYRNVAIGASGIGTDPNAAAPPFAYRNPYLPRPAEGTMQDCSPYPASLYDLSPAAGVQAARHWNALYGSNLQRDAALFEFSRPVHAFGAWFGDLETRPPDTPAWIRLFDADGAVVWEGPVPATAAASPTDAECGGTGANTDPLACGNQTTRWIGFVTSVGDDPVASMLVIVGDDDSCAQTTDCDATSEHFAWIGATIAEGNPDLAVTIDDGLDTVARGSTITTTVDVENVSKIDATGAAASVALPAGVHVVSASDGGTESSPGVVTWPIGGLDALDGRSFTLTVQVDAAAPLGASLGFVASVTDDGTNGDDPTPADNTATDTDRVGTVDLVVAIDDGVDRVAAGGETTWTIDWANLGSAAAPGTTIAIALPPGATLLDGSTTISIGPLDAGETGTATVTVRLPNSLTNGSTAEATATIGSEAPDENPTDNEASDSDDIDGVDLTIWKTDGRSTATVGSTVTYDITVANDSAVPATGVHVSDDLPAQLSLVTASDAPTMVGRTLVWGPLTLAPGESRALSVTATVNGTPGDDVTNAAVVADDGAHGVDADFADNVATDLTRITAVPATTTTTTTPRRTTTTTSASSAAARQAVPGRRGALAAAAGNGQLDGAIIAGSLARTGGAVGGLVAVGGALVGLGLAARRRSRRTAATRR
jgi:uncharacterized repeat protein (TIGR01451 family)